MGLSVAGQYKLVNTIHILQFILIIGAITVSIVRFALPNVTRTRNDTWILGVAAKSLAIMAYMVLTERVSSLAKWRSFKANMVLSIIEVVFWFAAFIMPAMNYNQCRATGCTLTAINIGIGATLAMLAIPVCLICIHHWRFFRANGYAPGSAHDIRAGSKEYSLSQRV